MLPIKIIILRIMISKIMGGFFILSETVISPRAPNEFTFLIDIPETFNIPIFPFIKDKPPRLSPIF
ncbi:MAG: hypothetical protein HY752_04645 [Nitrospirae bacterium]|nr:hypothetical protein [Nitrospirota bacterium]